MCFMTMFVFAYCICMCTYVYNMKCNSLADCNVPYYSLSSLTGALYHSLTVFAAMLSKSLL